MSRAVPARLPHGGRLQEASARFGHPPAGWLDLSTGLNPHAWPVPPVPGEVWHRLPDDTLIEQLAAACCEAYGAPAALPVAGTQTALQALPRALAMLSERAAYPWRVRLRTGSYAEHAQAWQRAGHRVELRRESLLDGLDAVDVLVLVHPDNPSGERLPVRELLAAHAQLAARGGWLLVDEAYLDALAPEAQARLSLAPHSDRTGLVVLRSVGKFYGLAGARVGAVLAARAVREALAAELGPWAVPGPSAWVATRALQDRPWAAAMRARLATEDARLAALLRARGLDPRGGPLYRCCLTPAAPQLQAALARAGVWTRLFEPATPDAAPAWRLGLPGDEAGWQRLAAALAAPEPTRLLEDAAPWPSTSS